MYGQYSKVSSRIAARHSWIDTTTCWPVPLRSRANSAPSAAMAALSAALEPGLLPEGLQRRQVLRLGPPPFR